MIGSFRTSVNNWLSHYLRADVYVSQGAAPTHLGIKQQTITALRGDPAVRKVTTGRWARLSLAQGTVRLFAVDVDARSFGNFQIHHGDRHTIWRRFHDHGEVIVSEAFAYHRGLSSGGSISLPTRAGPRRFLVAAIYRDYGSDQGTVVMHRRHYRQHWEDPAVDSLALYLRPGTDPGQTLNRLETGLLRDTGLRARSNRALRELSLQIFDRTFAITGVLRLLTMIIAVVAIVSALAAIQLERAREFAMLRAAGVTRRGVAGLLMGEGALMGLAAAVLSLPLGLLMSMVLIIVINRRSFGWTIDMALTPDHFVTALVLGGMAGLLAAVYPALRITGVLPAEGLRYE
jgi:putative ABC transport system permease protein